ncbi:tyrosine-type recombinase/integrase [Treponema pedis]|uniref:tyrosine-type recombinase/integrase n=2 Tax=Treponema pedis TaxID=409322 RepID=UPI003D24541D
MKELLRWYTYTRNGIIYVQFKDKITGKKLTAKSTRTRDARKAEAIINQWYYNGNSIFNLNQKESRLEAFKNLVRDFKFSEEELLKLRKDGFIFMITNATDYFKNSIFFTNSNINNFDDDEMDETTEEIYEIKKILNTLTFKDYLFLFWDYEKSPYIKQKYNMGKTVPNPERFKGIFCSLRKYEHLFDNTLLIKVTYKKINKILGEIKSAGNLKESYMSNIKYAIVQALNFASEAGLINNFNSKKITSFSNKNEKKEIFKKEELNTLFNNNTNPFGNELYRLFNEVLFRTGCRVGEIQALQINDLIKTKNGYQLNIDKNYCKNGHRIKETKTKRVDMVAISDNLAEAILNFIKINPFKDDANAFIFYSDNKKLPLNYNIIYKNFNATMKKLGFARKNLTIHSYRHTYATILLDSGFSELDLLVLTRHDDIQQVRRYGEHDSPEKELKKIKAAKIIATA